MPSLDFNQLATLIIVLAIAATASGFIAGLLGVGGGILMVPALYYAFSILEFDPNIIMHLSLGTSLAIIIPTSIMSAKTHYKFKAVNFNLIKSFGISVVIGIFIGTFMATQLKTIQLLLIFSIFSFCVGLCSQLLLFIINLILNYPPCAISTNFNYRFIICWITYKSKWY